MDKDNLNSNKEDSEGEAGDAPAPNFDAECSKSTSTVCELDRVSRLDEASSNQESDAEAPSSSTGARLTSPDGATASKYPCSPDVQLPQVSEGAGQLEIKDEQEENLSRQRILQFKSKLFSAQNPESFGFRNHSNQGKLGSKGAKVTEPEVVPGQQQSLESSRVPDEGLKKRSATESRVEVKNMTTEVDNSRKYDYLNVGAKCEDLTLTDGIEVVSNIKHQKFTRRARKNEEAQKNKSDTSNAKLINGMYNWQSTKMNVKDRLAYMFNNELLSDVHFIVGKEGCQQRIPGHKFVLSVGSAVFDAMFNSDLANRDEEVHLPDVEAPSFLDLLKFLYTDEVQIGPETVMTTLYTAKKYAVPALEKHCVDFLKRNLSADNAFMLLTQARLFDEPQLAALCLETIDKYTPESLNADGFVDIDIDTLSTVLDRDSLRAKEVKLFNAILKWAEAECGRQDISVTTENKRMVLGKTLSKIRFPLMTVEEFAEGPAQSGILSDRECVSLFLYFTVKPKPSVNFLDNPRSSMTGKEQTVSRFQQIETRWGYSGTSDKIRFIVDKRIFVVGFGLYGSIQVPSEYKAHIQIYHTGTGRILGSNDVTYLTDGSSSTFRVMFKEPIEILANTNYTANAAITGLDSHYGTKGMRKVFVESSMLPGGVTFQFSYAALNNNGTSVEDGQIPEVIFYL